MKKIDDKLSNFLKSRNFTHMVEVPYDSLYSEKEIEKLKRMYREDFDPSIKTKNTEVIDELTPDQIEMLFNLEATEARDEMLSRLDSIEDKQRRIWALVEKTETHLKVIKTIIVVFTVIAAVTALLSIIQYIGLSSALNEATRFKLY